MNTKKFEILEHTGDAKIKAFGKTKEELFLNAMLGMNAILAPKTQKHKNTKTRTVKIRSSDINALLVDFLNEANYLRQVHMEAYDKVKFAKFSDTELEAALEGRAVQEFGEDIKAITFHELGIAHGEQGVWQTSIVFDI